MPLAPANLVQLPEVSDDKAILISDIFPTGYFGAENAEIKAGDTVAVFGWGPVGLFAVVSARLLGRAVCSPLTRSPAGEGARSGAETIDFNADSPVERLRDHTGGVGVLRAIDAVRVDAYRPESGPAYAESRAMKLQHKEEQKETEIEGSGATWWGGQWKPGDDRPYRHQGILAVLGREDGLHGRLAPGDHDCPVEEVPKGAARRGFYHRGDAEVQQALESFFVNEFRLAALGWNQALADGEGGSNEAWASWLTYFHALRIPDDNHTYLLCRPEYANQDQLLFSAFLGLHLSEPLNQLSMESAAIRKRKEFTEEQARELATKREELDKRRTALREQLGKLDAEQARRMEVITGGDLATQLIEAQGKFVEANAEVAQIEEQVKTLTSQMQQSTATARRLREQIDLSRELSGLDVKICPNCARGIEEEALQREKESHQCRLCVRPVPLAGEDEAAPLEAAAKDYDRRAAELKARIAEVNRELAAARKRAEGFQSLTETLQATIKEGVTKELPTTEENERRGRLHEEIGGINQEIVGINRQLGGSGSGENHDQKAKIIAKVQLVLKEEAEQRNQEIETRLNELATEVIKALRADQITGSSATQPGW